MNLGLDAAQNNIIKAEEKAAKLGKNYKSSEARATKAENEVYNLQSKYGKSDQTKSVNNDSPDNKSKGKLGWKEVLGSLTNLTGGKKEENVVFMAQILKRLGLQRIHLSSIETEFSSNPSEAKYNIELLIKAGYINFASAYYDLTPAGRTFLIERMPDDL